VVAAVVALAAALFVATADAGIVLESQSGWSENETDSYGRAEHVHTEVNFPLYQVVDGPQDITITSKLHNTQNSNRMLRTVRLQDSSSTVASREPRQSCQVADCTFVNTLTLPNLSTGMHEIRIHSEIRSGVVSRPKNRATNGWQVCFRSCSPDRTQATAFPEGRGWYETSSASVRGYINGRFNGGAAVFPFQPVGGTWCPPLRILRGAGDEQVNRSFVTIDPSFHHEPEDPGLVQLDQAGPFSGNLCIDTGALGNGPHKLMLRAHSTSQFQGQLWGSLVIPFTVDNGRARLS
jgi:hypothetical protein